MHTPKGKQVKFIMASRKFAQEQPSCRVNWFSTFLIALLAVLVTIVALIKGKYIQYDQRAINKRYINPWMLKLAGHSYSSQAIVYHKGRKSGRSYTAPVAVEPVADGFIIPLPYGTDVDWCRNILAAGECTIQWRGKNYSVTKPELIDAEIAQTELSQMRQWIFRAFGVKNVLKVRISTTTAVSVA